MPNHIHGIIIINDNGRDLINQIPTENKNLFPLMKNEEMNLGKIIRFYKARTSRLIHNIGIYNFLWQRNYYEHIVRNEKDLNNENT